MGDSARAYVFYGIADTKESDLPWAARDADGDIIGEDDDDEGISAWEERYTARVHGLIKPVSSFPYFVHPDYTAEGKQLSKPRVLTSAEQQEYDEREQYQKRLEKYKRDIPFVIDTHGSSEQACWFVAVKESLISGDWEGPTEIKEMVFQHAWAELLEEFCKVMDIPFSPPRWWLCCYWG